MKLKSLLLAITICSICRIEAFKQGPEIQAGMLQNYANTRHYDNCKGLYLQVGYNIGKALCLSLYGSGFNGNKFSYFFPTLIEYGMTGFMPNGNNDTFYNITYNQKYKASQFLMKARITLNPDSRVNLFLQPAVGFTNLKEINDYQPQIHPRRVNSDLYTCLQFGAGLSVAVDKDKKIRLCSEISISKTYSYNSILDADTPAYSYTDIYLRQISFGISYRIE